MTYYNAFLGDSAASDVASEEEKDELRHAFVRFFEISLKCVNIYGRLSSNTQVHTILVNAFNKFVEETNPQLGHLHNMRATVVTE